MQLKSIITALEEFAPLSLQESYDNAGLLCGETGSEISSVLLTTDITEEVIDEAIEEGHQLIISHHPLAIRGFKNAVPKDYIRKCLVKAIKNDIALYAAHTNMDCIFDGVSGKMADKLELTGRKILQPTGKLYQLSFYSPKEYAEKIRKVLLEDGAGCIGKYSHCSFNSDGTGTFKPMPDANPFVGEVGRLHSEEEIKTEITVPETLLSKTIRTLIEIHPYEEPVWNVIPLQNSDPTIGFGMVGELEEEEDTFTFLQRVKEIFHCQVIRYTAPVKPRIKKIALCGGSGASLIPLAIQAGADIYLSADFKYHDFFLAENKLVLADIGHYESEQFTKEIFYEIITKKFPNFVVRFSRVNSNPINCI